MSRFIFYLLQVNLVSIYISTGIAGMVILAVVFYLIYQRLLRRESKNEGERIESSIDPKINSEKLWREINLAARNSDYRKATIFLFHQFRIICYEKFIIRNALNADLDEMKIHLRGIDEISLKDFEKITAIYQEARFTNKKMTWDDYQKMLYLIKKIKEI